MRRALSDKCLGCNLGSSQRQYETVRCYPKPSHKQCTYDEAAKVKAHNTSTPFPPQGVSGRCYACAAKVVDGGAYCNISCAD